VAVRAWIARLLRHRVAGSARLYNLLFQIGLTAPMYYVVVILYVIVCVTLMLVVSSAGQGGDIAARSRKASRPGVRRATCATVLSATTFARSCSWCRDIAGILGHSADGR